MTTWLDDLRDESVDLSDERMRAALEFFFPGSKRWITKNLQRQHAGWDYRIELASGKQVTADAKFRKLDYEDFALEFEHRHKDGRVSDGWIVDPRKTNDFIIYVVKKYTPLWKIWLIPFMPLREAFVGEGWLARYGERRSDKNNPTYISVICPVPRAVVERVIIGIKACNCKGRL